MVAVVDGQAWGCAPKDLYIPPDAFLVHLDRFEGPLDLLLYLIRRQNLDIMNIPIARVTQQYLAYIDAMVELKMDLVGDYLLMGATLAEIKSRMLLPKPALVEDEEDPRAELVRRLQVYEQFKAAADGLDAMPRVGRDTVYAQVAVAAQPIPLAQPTVDVPALTRAFQALMQRAHFHRQHLVEREPISIRARMADLVARCQSGQTLGFFSLLDPREGRMGLVVTFIAFLELVRQRLLCYDLQEVGGVVLIEVRSVD